MLIEVGEFCERVEREMDGLIFDLREETNRLGDEEAFAWRSSLPRLAAVLRHDALKDLHLYLGRRGSLSLEYRLPASASWADTVLLGRDEERSVAVVIELKHWDLAGDEAGPREGLVRHRGELVLHPAEQVRGYVEYCRKFHSAIQEADASVVGCVYFTHARDVDVYRARPHEALSRTFPLFSDHQRDVADRFPEHLARLLREPDPEFAQRFENGGYHQDRSFVQQVARTISDPSASPFVLLDQQRKGFEQCMAVIDRILAGEGSGQKAIVIVEGPPGSGKSVLAAHLWATLAQDARIRGNVVFATTSAAQRSNWEQLFLEAASHVAGRGIVIPANRFNPGLSYVWQKREQSLGRSVTPKSWKDNLDLYLRARNRNKCPDDSFDVTIVDEAHALIDPSVPGAEGIPDAGWSVHAGPQAWHIMRASRISVFLMDGEQSFRDNETTTRERIRELARDLGVQTIERVDLSGAQFRCEGSAEYLEWLDAVLGFRHPEALPLDWRRGTGGPFGLEIVDDPRALDEILGAHLHDGRTARLVASYARPWLTKEDSSPHSRAPQDRDFCIPYERRGTEQLWSRIWNFAPKGDYTQFIRAPVGSPMASDPLAEVGCPYVVRGFDYDFVGLLWLGDLVWRGRWEARLEHVHESGWPKTKKAARVGGPGSDGEQRLVRRLQRGYRILLSRAIRGLYIWFEDDETRAYIESCLRTGGA